MGKAQIAALLATNEPRVRLNFMDVQKQCGENDCGLFSISFATALAFGEQPGHYLFDQKVMRSHLIYRLFRTKKDVDVSNQKKKVHLKTIEDIPVYCVCRMPELPNTKWAQCSKCGITQILALTLYTPCQLEGKRLWHCPTCGK